MHYYKTRPDPHSVAFIKKFPCESHFGFTTKLGRLVEEMEQIVLPGAGFDLYEYDRKNGRVFEIWIRYVR